ncbi:uncharacterized protein LOC116029597 [Ipomoea triloba]|uniref:uncharacterized protein LOC116029597 n=1 Tax=Ipomoea triloba TaxID=35885 RepID=UPI00125E0CE1|nr:uncharacterized protein LOC116029597 [Ipomoea triloba]
MGDNSVLIDTLLQRLSSAFKIRDLRTPGFFLGIETLAVHGGLVLSQRRYIGDLLKRAGMTDCKPLATPASVTQYRRLAGALQYLTITRPDLSYSVNHLCQFMHAPTTEHWGLLKRVLRYVKGTMDYGLHMTPSLSNDIHAFFDSDWAGCPIDHKSTSGMLSFSTPTWFRGYRASSALWPVPQLKLNIKVWPTYLLRLPKSFRY